MSKSCLSLAPEEVVELSQKLVEKYHPELETARFVILFRSGDWAKLGNAAKLSGTAAFFARADFAIILNAEMWPKLGQKGQAALLDHLLTHCTGEEASDGSMKWRIRKHDFEEFLSIYQRWGAWEEGLKAVEEARDQMKLDFPDAIQELGLEAEVELAETETDEEGEAVVDPLGGQVVSLFKDRAATAEAEAAGE